MLHDQRPDTTLSRQHLEFEVERLEFLAGHGFDSTPVWITDPAGRRTYTMQRGNGDCPKLVLHGGLSESSEWYPLAGKLSGHVVVVDRPGFGLTHVPGPGSLEFRRDTTRWIVDVVDALAVPKVDLIGNSLGGFTSMVFALAHPERVRRLVLVGAPAGLHESLPLFVRLWGNPVVGQLIKRKGITDPEQMRAVADRILVSDAQRIPRRQLELMVAAAALPGVADYAFAMLRQVTTLRGWRRNLLLFSEMERLDVPTLFVWGEDDGFAPPSAAGRLWDRMPRGTLRAIPDAGHLPQMDQPGEVADAINRFLDQ